MRSFIYVIIPILITFSCKSEQSDQHLENVPKENLLNVLLEGNERFSEDHPIHPDQTLDRLRDLSQGQHPVAAVVSCSDSRVPPELIFDQGLGDLFVIRNAGNIVADYEIGSVEYAIEHLEVPLVIILGHTKCGAIGAFVEHEHEPSHHYSDYIQKIIDFIDAEEEEQVLQRGTVDFYEKAIEANVLHGIHELKNKVPLVNKLIGAKKLRIVGAIYDVETGRVKVLEDLD
ncbi:carbonic anhydrase [Belliella baltica DSM 15883]|uniref:Carbonic anhydrase n=1 Tax=Belliella baltica (strain DSM 15883 / CIP 108006 / LMG 21964 / BA134) TaxID=866536 RepID=I3Z2G3_BELBD|nr:carbonic anhydrase [Belliella baltica]AFL83431.1 carbonic anhydrase [Belliella baltica DSM 15883]